MREGTENPTEGFQRRQEGERGKGGMGGWTEGTGEWRK